MYVYLVSEAAHGGQKWVSDFLKLKLQTVVGPANGSGVLFNSSWCSKPQSHPLAPWAPWAENFNHFHLYRWEEEAVIARFLHKKQTLEFVKNFWFGLSWYCQHFCCSASFCKNSETLYFWNFPVCVYVCV